MALKGADRYVSARALADDVEHWLADEPVAAWPEPWRMRAGRWVRRHKTAITALSVGLILLVAGSIALLFVEERRRHQAREFEQSRLFQVREHLSNLQKSAENAEQLVGSEIAAGRFASAAGILQQACDRLREEPSLEPLRAKLQLRQERLHRLVQFFSLADAAERLVYEEEYSEALTVADAALATLEIARHDDWWDHLPDADLSLPQREHLRNEAYRQILLAAILSSLRANQDSAVLDLLLRAERFRPSMSARVLKLAHEPAPTDGARNTPPTSLKPTSAIDYYFLGMFHFAMVDSPDKPVVKRIMLLGQPETFGLLDLKSPLATAAAHFRKAIDLQPQHPFTYLFLARIMISTNQFREAELAVNACVGLRPEFEVGYMMRAFATYRQGVLQTDPPRKKELLDSTMADLATCMRLNPKYGQTYYVRAQVYEAQHDHDKAIADYAQVIQLLPSKKAQAYRSRGMIYYTQKQHDRAIKDFDECIRLDPTNQNALNARGFAWYLKKDYDKAITDYSEAIRIDPKFVLGYGNRAIAWIVKNDYEKAFADLDEAIRLDPKNVAAHNARGFTWYIKKDYGKAIADYNEAIRLDPNNVDAHKYRVDAHNKRGFAWYLKKDYDKAIADYSEAIRLDPKNVEAHKAHNNRGLAWYLKKDYDKAIADYSEAIRIDPKYVLGYRNRANAWSAKKDYEKAIADYDELIRLDPKNVDVHNYRGNVWSAKKDYDKAIADYSEAIRIDPKYALGYHNRGKAWNAKKDYEKAIADHDEAIRLDPKFMNAYSWRGKSQYLAKQYDAALASWQEALKIDPKFTWGIMRTAHLMATCPDAKYRDAKKALELAKTALDLQKNPDAEFKEMAAAVFAEAGDFPEAVRLAGACPRTRDLEERRRRPPPAGVVQEEAAISAGVSGESQASAEKKQASRLPSHLATGDGPPKGPNLSVLASSSPRGSGAGAAPGGRRHHGSRAAPALHDPAAVPAGGAGYCRAPPWSPLPRLTAMPMLANLAPVPCRHSDRPRAPRSGAGSCCALPCAAAAAPDADADQPPRAAIRRRLRKKPFRLQRKFPADNIRSLKVE